MTYKTRTLELIERDALRIAEANKEHVTDVHMLLAIARGDGTAERVLKKLGVTTDVIIEEAKQMLDIMYFI